MNPFQAPAEQDVNGAEITNVIGKIDQTCCKFLKELYGTFLKTQDQGL